MDITLYLAILWRRKFVIVFTFLVTVVATAAVTMNMTPIYTAKTTVRVATSTDRTVDYGDYVYSTRFLNTLASVVQTDPLVEQARKELDLNPAAEFEVDVEFPGDTELMRVVIISEDPLLAANVANTLTTILVEESREIRRANTVTIVELAQPPKEPSSPNTKVNLVLASMAGLVGGVGLAFLLENLDRTLYNQQQIEKVTALSVLARIPPVQHRNERYTWLNGDSPHSESFRRLRTMLANLDATDSLRTIMVTSAQPQEGKSTVVANLAATLAETGRRVAVIDADLRLPMMHTIFGLPNETGLSNLLNQEVSLKDAIQPGPGKGLFILTSGSSEAVPASLLASPRMKVLLDYLAQRVDHILIDTPSFLAVNDAATLVPLVDGVVLVVSCAQAQSDTVKVTCEQLAHLKATLIGVIMNKAPEQHMALYQDYYQRKAKKNRTKTAKS